LPLRPLHEGAVPLVARQALLPAKQHHVFHSLDSSALVVSSPLSQTGMASPAIGHVADDAPTVGRSTPPRRRARPRSTHASSGTGAGCSAPLLIPPRLSPRSRSPTSTSPARDSGCGAWSTGATVDRRSTSSP